MNFASLFEQIHGHRPFPWQEEAARRLIEGEPIEAVIVPTACGKTALIDAAIYAAAHGGSKRIAFIIDRRVVVDEAYERACKIRDALQNPATAELEAFNAKLGPIQVNRLRGGVHGDDDWVIYPDRVTVLVSTVDQVGSRLLFRGYGVSPRMAPVHAGFVGNDALYLIDEAHLSNAFLDTVEAVRAEGAELRLIPLSATFSSAAEGVLALSHDDWQVPTLRARVEASKRARLVPVAGGRAPLVDAAVREAVALANEDQVIGIVVNRVDTARLIWQKLTRKTDRVSLLTGRIRPYDRDRLLECLLPAIGAGRAHSENDALFVVATQTIEVGANLDFDALVTEAAPLSSLRQRFGRLDRLGTRRTSEAAVLYPEPKRRKDKSPEPDPVYGNAVHTTWAWLESVAEAGVVDFGVRHLEDTTNRHPPPEEPLIRGPSLLPSHITLLAQTGPQAPHVDVGPWLHGAGKARADVSVIWRADLAPDQEADWPAIVRLRPPITQEAMELPFVAARSWLQGKRDARFSDLEGAENASETDRQTEGDNQRSVVRWRGLEACDVIQPTEIRPSDTLIVPAVYGGCDRFGWSPSEHRPVDDVADFCSAERGRAHIVRLTPGLCGWLGTQRECVFEAVAELVAAETEEDPEIGIDPERVKAARATLRQQLAAVNHPLLKALGRRSVIERYPAGVVLRGQVMDDIRGTLTGGVAVPLDAHLIGVGQQARAIAKEHPECERIAAAAALHDLGKREPRFQAMLHGDALQAALGPALAKSGLRRLRELRESYAQSGLPRGFRHEFGSLDLIEEPDLLTRYLIAAHHGYGRPWVPACADPEAPGAHYAELETHWLGVFAKLVEDVGPWRLAGMELLLRAADARQSRREQETADA